MQLARSTEPLVSHLQMDGVTRAALEPFDLDSDTAVEFYPWEPPQHSGSWGVGVIVGASGTGKSTLLHHYGTPAAAEWDNTKPIAGHFATPDEAIDKLTAVGLCSVPAWKTAYNTLSTGQKFRADMARTIGNNAVIDEYTSVVDRTTAASASKSLRSWIDRNGVTGMVLATCHRDILDWLQPDWIIDTDTGTFQGGGERQRLAWDMLHNLGGIVGRITAH